MARDNEEQIISFEHNSAGGDLDTDTQYFSHDRPILITKATFIGSNPSDTDTDTTAIDADHSTDGFSSDVNEILSLAAQEYNDTTRHAQFGTADGVAVDVPLKASALVGNPEAGVRVPGGATIRVQFTNVGAGADTRYFFQLHYRVL